VDKTVQNLEGMTLQLNSKDNSLGLLLHDRSLYLHLDSVAANISDLALDLRLNPKRYLQFSVFGGKK
jgi:phospholipid/cholesterol/gamma-HCH transport system substrate-binding protein